MARPRVLVIGAGIAGLTAAFDLHHAGVEVQVLEASTTPGGRMCSPCLGGLPADGGAQFLIANYTEIFRLLDATGLRDELVPFAPWFRDYHTTSDGQLSHIEYNLGSPLQTLFSGLLDWPTQLRHGPAIARLYLGLRRYSSSDYGDWHALDSEEAVPWLRRNFGQAIIDRVLDPLIENFYFQPTEQLSKAAACALIQQFNQPCYSLRRGLGSLPEALAERVDVSYGVKIVSVEQRGNEVLVETESGQTHHADWAIVATPAPIAKQLIRAPLPLEQPLLETPYSRTATLNLQLDPAWRLDTTNPIYTLQLPRNQRRHLTALTLDPKCAPGAPRIAGLYLTEATAELLDRTDAEVAAAMLADADHYLPGASGHVQQWHLHRWPHAVPYYPVGRSRAIHAYQQECPTQHRLLLAGDYMGLIGVNGAAYAGAWAAGRVARHTPNI